MGLTARVTADQKKLQTRYPQLDANAWAGRTCEVEKRVFEGSKLVGYVLFETPQGVLGGSRFFDADLIESRDTDGVNKRQAKTGDADDLPIAEL